MVRPKSNGPYAPLSATYYRDDAILEVGEEAELLFVRCLAFLADAASDGFITERQMTIVVAMGLERVADRIDALLSVGLIERIDGGFIVRSWLKWNRSTDEIGKHLKRDRERKSRDRKTESSTVPDGIRVDSVPQVTTNQVNTIQSTKDLPSKAEHEKSDELPVDILEVDYFTEVWDHWPKKDDKKGATARWPNAVRESKLSERALTDIAIAHGDAYRAHRSKQFTPAFVVWLNKGRWANELPQPEERSRTRGEENVAFVAQLAERELQRGIGS